MLSLAEAETLRAALHEHLDCALFPGETLSVSLTVMAPTSLGMTLDSSHGFWPAGSYQTGIVTHCSRFIDSETNYSDFEANLLLQALQVTKGPSLEQKHTWGHLGNKVFRRFMTRLVDHAPPFDKKTPRQVRSIQCRTITVSNKGATQVHEWSIPPLLSSPQISLYPSLHFCRRAAL
jgi:hypothetical protein